MEICVIVCGTFWGGDEAIKNTQRIPCSKTCEGNARKWCICLIGLVGVVKVFAGSRPLYIEIHNRDPSPPGSGFKKLLFHFHQFSALGLIVRDDLFLEHC